MGKVKQSLTNKVLQHLKRFGNITTKQICLMLLEQQRFTTCPHSIIRDLREKYTITDIWERDPEKGGRYKRYFLKEAEERA